MMPSPFSRSRPSPSRRADAGLVVAQRLREERIFCACGERPHVAFQYEAHLLPSSSRRSRG
jgi:hypothetical protein